MRTVDVAARAGISQPSVTRAEQGEAEGTIQLDTLRRMAAAMDCVVVYAIVPRRSLQETVEAQARRVAERELARVSRLMALEDQTPAAADARELLEKHAARVLSERRDLWRDA